MGKSVVGGTRHQRETAWEGEGFAGKDQYGTWEGDEGCMRDEAGGVTALQA